MENCSVLSAEKISEWTRYDPVLAHVHEYLLHVQDAVYFGVLKLSFQSKVLNRWWASCMLHIQALTEGACKELCLWPGMDSDLENLVHKCTTCQEHQHAPVAAPLHPLEFPDGPWEWIHVDYAGPFKGEMLLVVVNAFSKWFEVAIMTWTTSKATIRRLREIFAQHGLLDMLVSNNGTNISSEEFAEFQRSNGIIHVKTALYHPSTKGLAERNVQTVKEGITKTPGDCIHTKLHHFLLQYRITPQSMPGWVQQSCWISGDWRPNWTCCTQISKTKSINSSHRRRWIMTKRRMEKQSQ